MTPAQLLQLLPGQQKVQEMQEVLDEVIPVDIKLLIAESDEDKNKLLTAKHKSKEDANLRTLRFLALESKRLEAKTFLYEAGQSAVHFINRKDAFDYLSNSCSEAVAQTIHLVRKPRATLQQAPPNLLQNIMRRTSRSIAQVRRTSNADVDVRRKMSSMRGFNPKTDTPNSPIISEFGSPAQSPLPSRLDSPMLFNSESKSNEIALSFAQALPLTILEDDVIDNSSSQGVKKEKKMIQKDQLYFEGNSLSNSFFPPLALEDPAILKQYLVQRSLSHSMEDRHHYNYHSFGNQHANNQPHSKDKKHSQFHIEVVAAHNSGAGGAHLALISDFYTKGGKLHRKKHGHRSARSNSPSGSESGGSSFAESLSGSVVLPSQIIAHSKLDNGTNRSNAPSKARGSNSRGNARPKSQDRFASIAHESTQQHLAGAINADVISMLSKRIGNNDIFRALHSGDGSAREPRRVKSPSMRKEQFVSPKNVIGASQSTPAILTTKFDDNLSERSEGSYISVGLRKLQSAGKPTAHYSGYNTKSIPSSYTSFPLDEHEQDSWYRDSKSKAERQERHRSRSPVHEGRRANLPVIDQSDDERSTASFGSSLIGPSGPFSFRTKEKRAKSPNRVKTPKSATSSSRPGSSQKNKNNLNFLDGNSEDADILINKSLDQFKRTGFSNGNSVYRSYWRRKVQVKCMHVNTNPSQT